MPSSGTGGGQDGGWRGPSGGPNEPNAPPTLPSHRLMVNLTQPALLCFGKVPPDATSRHHFLQVLSYLQAYKEVSLPGEGPLARPLGGGLCLGPPSLTQGFLQAFASEKVFGVLSEKLYDLLQLVSPVGTAGSILANQGWGSCGCHAEPSRLHRPRTGSSGRRRTRC